MIEKTDYKPGDEPVPVGTLVFYQGSLKPGVYEVILHVPASDRPAPPPPLTREEVYPDGVAYSLWPVGVANKRGNGHLGINAARRTSFRININLEG